MAEHNPLREGVAEGEVVDDRYTIVSRIGSGGMADVYCAQDAQLGRRVALKVLHRRFAEDQDFVERFRREASAAAGLQHPNVVQVYDRGELEGTYSIAMELLEGRTLKQLVHEEGPLDPDRAIDITVQVLRAARFAHKRGVIHRDFKPHNVIVDAEGRVKVTDFGIARAGASDMTETGAIMGTAAYLSPEQAQGHAVSASSDLYSVGILLYELLTGRVPFDAESAVTIALKQVSEEPVPPRALNPAVSPELEDVVLRALQKDPARRFADADEFVAALEAVRELPARPDVSQRTGPLTGVYPALAEYEPYVAKERRGRRAWVIALVVLLALAAAGVGLFLVLRPEQVTVPKVVGFDSATATTRINNEGFEVSLQPVRSADQKAGIVIRQRPNPGDRADKKAVVTIFVSSGPGQAEVPDVTDQPLKAARKAVEKRGFKVELLREFSDTVAVGRVIETRPPARTQIDIGKTVTLVASKGPEQTAVPDVTGLSEAEARARLADAGFATDSRRQESATVDAGLVISTTPAAKALGKKGETVTLVVARAPAKTAVAVAVPDVRGETINEALADLTAAGLRPRQRSRLVTNPDQDGVVLDQRPAKGTRLAKGATVTLVVGRFDDSKLNPEGNGTPTPSATPPSLTPTPVP
ncbi:MAG: protein kinase domain-containing protein [Solirubrobacteraceae bacterium]